MKMAAPPRMTSAADDQANRLAALETENERLKKSVDDTTATIKQLKKAKSNKELKRLADILAALEAELAENQEAAEGEQGELAGNLDQTEQDRMHTQQRLDRVLRREKRVMEAGIPVRPEYQENPIENPSDMKKEILRLHEVFTTLLERRELEEPELPQLEVARRPPALPSSDIEEVAKYKIDDKIKFYEKSRRKWMRDGKVVMVIKDPEGTFKARIQYNNDMLSKWVPESSKFLRLVDEDTESEKEEGPEQVNIWEEDNGEDFDKWNEPKLKRKLGSLNQKVELLEDLKESVELKLGRIKAARKKRESQAQAQLEGMARRVREEEEARIAAEKAYNEPLKFSSGTEITITKEGENVVVYQKDRRRWYTDGKVEKIDKDERKFYVTWNRSMKFKWFVDGHKFVRPTSEHSVEEIESRDHKAIGLSDRGYNAKERGKTELEEAQEAGEDEGSLVRIEYRRRLKMIFKEYDKPRRKEVESILDEHEGSEHDIYVQLCNKYGDFPLPPYHGMEAYDDDW